MIQWNCEKLTFGYCTSSLLVQMFGSRKCKELHLMLILSRQDLLQSLGLEKKPLSTMLSTIAHVTILAVITCAMNVGN